MRHRVCHFTASPEPSGVGEHMLMLAAGLRERYDVTFGCISSGPGAHLLTRAAALGVAPLPLDGRGWKTDPEIARLREWLRAERVALFHLHAGVGWEGHTATYAAREAGTPAIVRTEHLPDVIRDPEERASHERLLSVVDRLICVSVGAAASMVEAGVPASKIRVVRNGVAAPDPLPGVPHPALALSPGARTVLTVARFTEQKGHRVLLEAIPVILAACCEARFLWVGTGPLEQALREEVRSRGLASAVVFLGQRDDVPALLAAADLVVLPSLFEGLPLVVLEAMAAGRPVVATRACGTDEAVHDGVTGWLVPPGDAAALATAVVEALASPELAMQWGLAGRERWHREFTAARMVRETAAVYDELLDGRVAMRLTGSGVVGEPMPHPLQGRSLPNVEHAMSGQGERR
jgi:glycosyltransferase involved in cell wall biosynthesis